MGVKFTNRGICLVLIAGLATALPNLAVAQAALKTDPALYAKPSEGGARRWEVSAAAGARFQSSPAQEARLLDRLPQGAILSSFGCRTVADQVWCQVRPFRGGARGVVNAARLTPAIGPDGVMPTGRDDSERRARKGAFDASGIVPCAQEMGEALGDCEIGVSRGTGGDATIVATFLKNGFARRLSFVHGEFTSANTTMSGTGTDTDWAVVDGIHMIRVDDQRFEIPNALVFGK